MVGVSGWVGLSDRQPPISRLWRRDIKLSTAILNLIQDYPPTPPLSFRMGRVTEMCDQVVRRRPELNETAGTTTPLASSLTQSFNHKTTRLSTSRFRKIDIPCPPSWTRGILVLLIEVEKSRGRFKHKRCDRRPHPLFSSFCSFEQLR